MQMLEAVDMVIDNVLAGYQREKIDDARLVEGDQETEHENHSDSWSNKHCFSRSSICCGRSWSLHPLC